MPPSNQQTGDSPALPHVRAELLKIIGEVLGEELPTIPDDTPILDIVHSSLSLVEGMRRIHERFGVLISIRRVIEGQSTLAGIAAYIEQELAAQRSRKNEIPAIRQAEPKPVVSRQVRLTPSQRHVGFLARYSNEAAAAFNESVAVQLEGSLDGPALQAAVDAVADRYEALHASLSPDKDELRVCPGQPLEMRVSECLPEGLEQKLAEITGRPFPPGERLFRAELLRLSDAQHILVLVSSALVVETEALQLVLRELAAYYSAYVQDRKPNTGLPALQLTDYLAVGEANVAVHAKLAAQAFWQDLFTANWPRLELPADHPRPPVKRYLGARLVHPLRQDLVVRLQQWAQSQGMTLAEIILGAFGVYLSRLSGQRDLVVGVQSTPLYLDVGQPVVAPTRNMLPIRCSVDPQRSLAQHVRA